MSKLTEFEGRDVYTATVAITRAGDGLSDAMKVEPIELHHGETVYVVLECEVARVQFDPYDKDDPDGPLKRIHTLRAGTATLVDADLVQEQIREQADRILRAKEEEDGILRLEPLDDDPAAEGDPADDDEWEDPPADTKE